MPPGAPDLIQGSTVDWFAGASASRSDMLVLGDSVVWHYSNGWDAGFISALSRNVGLAATGLSNGIGGEGEGYSIAPGWQSGWTNLPEASPTRLRGYVWRDTVDTPVAAPFGPYNAYSANTTLKGDGRYDWHLYTGSATGGSFTVLPRLGAEPWTVQADPVRVSAPASTGGLKELVLSFEPPPGQATLPREFRIEDASGFSIYYSRLSVPGAKGASVSSWGYGGHSTRAFLTDQWKGQGMLPDGRKAWFDALVSRGSGKLNIVIAEGFNDRNETQPSLTAGHYGNTAEAFYDNMKTLIGQVRAEWVASGRNANDLTFTLLGMYDDLYEDYATTNNTWLQLHSYAAEAARIAAEDPQVSFINLGNHAPTYDQAVAAGYMTDGVHASREGVIAYARAAVDTLQLYAGQSFAAGPSWKKSGSGNWSDVANWSASPPPDRGATATFNEAIPSASTITLDQAVSLSGVRFDNRNSYTIEGASRLTLAGASGAPATLNVYAGNHAIDAPMRVESPLEVRVPYLSGLTLRGELQLASGQLTKMGGGDLSVRPLTIQSLHVRDGVVHFLPSGRAGTVYIGDLSMSATAALDLNDNDVVIDLGANVVSFEQIHKLLMDGYGSSEKIGIYSSTARASGDSILVLLDNALVGLPDWPPGSGHTIAPDSVIGVYTYFGDANLDGRVTADDGAILDANLGTSPLPGVAGISGDLNLDGVVSMDDYAILDSALGKGDSSPSGASAMPEPGGLSLLALGAGLLLRRRR